MGLTTSRYDEESIKLLIKNELTNHQQPTLFLMNEKDKQIEELTKQINALKTINANLEKEKVTIVDHKQSKQLSKLRVNEFVDQLLQDHAVNIEYLPDFVEKQIYRNVLNLLIGLLNHTLDSTNIEFLGHDLKFTIQPHPNDQFIEKEPILNQKEEEPVLIKTDDKHHFLHLFKHK